MENSALAQFPIIGEKIQLHALKGSVAALAIGLVTSLLAGMGVTGAAQNAFDRVWAVPYKDRPNFLQQRARGLGLLTFLGILFLISTVASGLVSGGFGGVGAKILGYVVALLVNFALFFAAFRFMTASAIPSRDLRSGVIVAGVTWTILQSVGGYYIGHVLKKQSSVGADVRAGDRAAGVAAPRRPDDPLRCGDQRGVDPPAVAAQPVRAARRRRGPADAPGTGEGRGTLTEQHVDVEFKK